MASGSKVAVANTSTYIQGCIDWTANVSGSNIVVNVSFYMRRTNAYSGSTYSSTATPNIMISGSKAWNYTGSAGITVAGGQQNVWQHIYSASRTYSAGYGGTTIYVGWNVTSDNSGYLGGSNYIGITLPTAYTAPATPTVSVANSSSDPAHTIDVTYGTTSFGVPSSGTVALYGDTSATPTTQINTKTTTGNSTFNHTGLTGNTSYYYRSRAANSALNSNFSTVPGISTFAEAPTITVNSTDYQSALISLASPVQGSAHTMYMYYSLDGGTDVLVGEITSGNFLPINLSLPPNTSHTITAYIKTSKGDSATTTATFRTKLPFYGSVSSQTKEITKLYGSVGGQTKLIQHLYGPVPHQTLDSVTGGIRAGGAGNITAFDAGDFYTTISADSTLMDYAMDRTVSYLVLNYDSGTSEWTLTLGFGNGDTYLVSNDQGPYTLAELGITANLTTNGDDYIDLVGAYETIYKSKLIF